MEGLSSVGMGLFSKMVDSWKREQFCDVTIKCANLRKIKAPSILISTISCVLADYLEQCCDNVLSTTEISIHLWRKLLHVLYDGNLDCLQNEDDDAPTIRDIRIFAETLGIQSVIDMCDKELDKESDGESEQRHLFKFIDKNPFEYNLVIQVSTGGGKARVTVQLKAQEVDNFEELLPKDMDNLLYEDITELDETSFVPPIAIVKEEPIEEGEIANVIEPLNIIFIKTEDESETEEPAANPTEPQTEHDQFETNQTEQTEIVKFEVNQTDPHPESDEDYRPSSEEDDVPIVEKISPKKPARKKMKPKPKAIKVASTTFMMKTPRLCIERLENMAPTNEKPRAGKRKTWTKYGDDFVVSDDEESANEDSDKDPDYAHDKPSEMPKHVEPTPTKKRVKTIKSVAKSPKKKAKLMDDQMAVLSMKEKICFLCTDKCKSEKVQCRVCFKVVNGKTLKHVQDEHPILNNVIWPVTCAVDDIEAEEQNAMIGRSIVGYMDDKATTMYHCITSEDMFIDQDQYEQSLRDHNDAVFSCSNSGCHYAFNTESMRMEHQHFCGGGCVIICPKCKSVLGGMIGLSMHKCGKDPKSAEYLLKRTGPRDTIAQAVQPKNTPTQGVIKPRKARMKKLLEIKENSNLIKKGLTPITKPPKLNRNAIIEENVLERIGTDLIPLGVANGAQHVGHLMKCCKNCGCICQAPRVQCLYCGQFVAVEDEEEHVLKEHGLTPVNHTWPVQCTRLPEVAPQFVVCKFDETIAQSKRDGNADETKDDEKGGKNKTDILPGKCLLCDFTCEEKNVLITHMKPAHECVVFFCSRCDYGINDVTHYGEHLYYCEGNSMYACARCDYFAVGSLKEAKEHEEKHHTLTRHINKKLFKEVHTTDRALRTIQRIQRCFQCGLDGCQNPKCMVKCVYCTQIVENNMDHMLEHPFTPATSIWPVMCRYQSGKQVQNVNPIIAKRIPVEVKGKQGSLIKCSFCDFQTQRRDQIVQHMKTFHSAKVVNACSYCDTVFNKYEAWRDHEHFCSGGDLLVCGICNQTCGGLKALNDHLCRNHPEAKGLMSQAMVPKSKAPQKKKKSSKKMEGESDDDADDSKIVIKPTPENPDLIEFADEGDKNQAKFDLKALRQVCFTCGEKGCKKDNVKCMYCRRIVGNTLQHMQHHWFTPSESSWPVNCNEEADQSTALIAMQSYFGKSMKVRINCVMCNAFSSAGFNEMYRHLKQAHDVFEVYRCKPCGSIFNEYSPFKDHTHFCSGGSLIKCDICDEVCGGYQLLINHITDKHSDQEDAPVQVNSDGASIEVTINTGPNGSMLLSAYALGQEEDKERIEIVEESLLMKGTQDCYVCEGECRLIPKGETIKCFLCCKMVDNDIEHMKECHPHSPENINWPVSCRIAHGYHEKVVVSIKSATVHPSDGHYRYECQICDFSCKTEESHLMVAHQKNEHTNGCFFCQHCECAIRRVREREDHERYCGGHGYPWCDVCGRRCYGMDNLHTHMRFSHYKDSDGKTLDGGGMLTKPFSENDTGMQDGRRSNVVTYKKRKPAKDPRAKRKTMGLNFDPAKGRADKNGIVTLCGLCGTHCIGVTVRCFLCFENVANDSDHVIKEHPFTPTKTWIVNCRQVKTAKVYKAGGKGDYDCSGVRGIAQSVAYVVSDVTKAQEATDLSEVGVRVGIDIKCALTHEPQDGEFGTFATMEDFNEHLKAVHPNSKGPVRICKHCNYIFSEFDMYHKDVFEDHERFCSCGGLYWCEQCSMPFTGIRRLRMHNHAMKHEGRYKPKPPKGFYSQYVEVPEGQFIQCLECGLKSSNWRDYRNHVQDVHRYKECQVHVCSYCYKPFKSNHLRHRHEQKEHKGGKVVCEICHKEYPSQLSLTAHRKYAHEGGRIKQKLYRDTRQKLPCQYCGRMFRNPMHVRHHEATAHLNEKPFQCRICGQRFSNHSQWRKHEARHTGIKNYKCPYCDYRNYCGSSVNEHIRNKHPGHKRAYGYDVIKYNENEIIDKGDEFIIDGKPYKPRLDRKQFDFESYEETMMTPSGKVIQNNHGQIIVETPGSKKHRPRIVTSSQLPGASGDGTVSTQQQHQQQQQMYVIQGNDDSSEPMAVYMTEAELQALQADSDIKYIIDNAATNDGNSAMGGDQQSIQYIVDNGANAGDSTDIKYVMGGDSATAQDIQYALGEVSDNESKDIRYIIDTSVADNTKQEVELIINSTAGVDASIPTSGTMVDSKVFLKSLLGNVAGEGGALGASTTTRLLSANGGADAGGEQVYYIVNK